MTTVAKKEKTSKSPKVTFVPFRGLVVLELPESVYPSDGLYIGNVASWKQILMESLKKEINNKFKVAAIGEGVTFVKPGDVIALSGNCIPQQYETEREGSEYPTVWLIVREMECMIKDI